MKTMLPKSLDDDSARGIVFTIISEAQWILRLEEGPGGFKGAINQVMMVCPGAKTESFIQSLRI